MTVVIYGENKITFVSIFPDNSYEKKSIDRFLRKTFKKAGYQYKSIYYPALRGEKYSKSGELDGECARSSYFEDNNSPLIRIDEVFIKSYITAYSHKSLIMESFSIDRLIKSNYRIGYFKNVRLTAMDNMNKLKESNLIKVDSDEKGFELLKSNRIDIFIVGSKFSAEKILNTEKFRYDHYNELGVLKIDNIYIYINKKYAHLIPLIKKSIIRFRKLVEKRGWNL